MRTSRRGIEQIKAFEGLRTIKYGDIAGKMTIGYGHLIAQDENFPRAISEVQAEALLIRDLARMEAAVNKVVTAPVTQWQYDMLVSFTFNLGPLSLTNSTLLKRLNAQDYTGAADEFLKWNKFTNPKTKKKEVSKGLAARRAKERDIFINGYST